MKSTTWRDVQQGVGEVAHGPAPRPGRRPGATPLVALLIAGDPGDADLYGLKLRLDGYTVVPATGLERGLELAAARRPDVIFVCLGSWAVPALVLLMLRSERATQGVPTVLVTDMSAAQLTGEIGRLRSTENVVHRRASVHGQRSRASLDRQPACRHRAGWERWLTLGAG